jgi:hypothetical protein
MPQLYQSQLLFFMSDGQTEKGAGTLTFPYPASTTTPNQLQFGDLSSYTILYTYITGTAFVLNQSNVTIVRSGRLTIGSLDGQNKPYISSIGSTRLKVRGGDGGQDYYLDLNYGGTLYGSYTFSLGNPPDADRNVNFESGTIRVVGYQ